MLNRFLRRKNIFIVLGLGYGDEGKGTIVDYLVRKYDVKAVIRFNGGPQAAHNVITPRGQHHCFSQFGSGTLSPGVLTFLSKEMLIEPVYLLREAEALRRIGITDAMKRIFIDPGCFLVTPLHKMIGRLLEVSRGEKRHSSTGLGVGQAAIDRKKEEIDCIQLRDCFDSDELRNKIEKLFSRTFKRTQTIIDSTSDREIKKEINQIHDNIANNDTPDRLYNIYKNFTRSFSSNIVPEKDFLLPLLENGEDVILEGAQGVLLDPIYGFPPYVTKTDCTFENAERLLSRYNHGYVITKIGIVRAYMTRHGKGPLVTENEQLNKYLKDVKEEHNLTNEWQGQFRVGWFDLLATKHAMEIAGEIDYLALTNVDKLAGLPTVNICQSYKYKSENEYRENLLNTFEDYFTYEQSENEFRITSLKPVDGQDKNNEKRTGILLDCKPGDIIEFKGWNRDFSSIKTINDFQCELKEFIHFLEKGLNKDILVVSFGPTADDKVIVE